MHFLAHFGKVKKTMKKIGSEKVLHDACLKEGRRDLELFGQWPYGNNTFQKGASPKEGSTGDLCL